MSHYTDLANLFDKLADELEREPPAASAAAPAPSEKKASATPTRAAQLSELVKSATGEDLPEDVADRIAKDDGLFEHVAKIAEHGARPAPMGEAVTKGGGATAPMTKQAKLASSWDRWNQSLLNNG